MNQLRSCRLCNKAIESHHTAYIEIDMHHKCYNRVLTENLEIDLSRRSDWPKMEKSEMSEELREWLK